MSSKIGSARNGSARTAARSASPGHRVVKKNASASSLQPAPLQSHVPMAPRTVRFESRPQVVHVPVRRSSSTGGIIQSRPRSSTEGTFIQNRPQSRTSLAWTFNSRHTSSSPQLHGILNQACEISVDGPKVHLANAKGGRITVFEAGPDSTQQVQMLQQICTAAQQLAPQAWEESLQKPIKEACCICFEEHARSNGVSCSGSPLNHFVCDECFASYVSIQCGQDAPPCTSQNGDLVCPGHHNDGTRCSASFDSQEVAKHTTREVFDVYWSYRSRIVEARLATEMEAALSARAEADERRGEAAKHRLRIAELMTLKCPRCGQAFTDFVNCFALKCPRPTCKAAFCGWCLKDCGKDAHHHVAYECPVGRRFSPSNPVWSTATKFEAAHSEQRRQDLNKYLQALEPKLREEVIQEIRPDLEAWGLHSSQTAKLRANSGAESVPAPQAAPVGQVANGNPRAATPERKKAQGVPVRPGGAFAQGQAPRLPPQIPHQQQPVLRPPPYGMIAPQMNMGMGYPLQAPQFYGRRL